MPALQPSPHSPLTPYLRGVPTNTRLRFALLVMFIGSLTVAIYGNVPFAIFPSLTQMGKQTSGCVWDALMHIVSKMDWSGPIPTPSEPWTELWTPIHRCTVPWMSYSLLWQAGGFSLLLVVTGVLYWFWPPWVLWRRGLRPLTVTALVADGVEQEPAAALVSCLGRLVAVGYTQHADVTPCTAPLEFLWDPLDTSPPNADTFGRLGHYYVALNKNLVQRFATDPGVFEAVVLHELSHVQPKAVDRFKDADLADIARALCGAFQVTTLVPASLAMLLTGAWNMSMSLAIGLALVVGLTRNAFQRSRELFADVRAAAWTSHYQRALETVLSPPTPSAPPRRRFLWPLLERPLAWQPSALVRAHPPLARRLAVVANPRLLFHTSGFWEALGLGLAGTVVAGQIVEISMLLVFVSLPHMGWMVSLWTSQGSDWLLVLQIGLGTTLLLSGIAIPLGAVGLGLWRMTLADMIQPVVVEAPAEAPARLHGVLFFRLVSPVLRWLQARCEEPSMRLIPVALGLIVGVLGGDLLTFLSFRSEAPEQATGHLPSVGQFLGFELSWGVLFVGCMLFFLRWVVAGATVWIEASLAREERGGDSHACVTRLRRACYAGWGAGCGVLACWFVPLLSVYFVTKPAFMAAPALFQKMLTIVWVFPVAPFLVPAFLVRLLGFWAFPTALVGLLSLWAFPFAAWWWQRGTCTPRHAGGRGLSSGSDVQRRQDPLRPGLAVVAGLLGGLVYWVGLSTIGVEVLRAVLDAKEHLPEYAVTAALVVPAWLLQAGVAAVVGSLTRRLPVVHGLLAACVVAVVAFGGLEGFFALRNDEMNAAEHAVLIFILMANGGVLPAMLMAWLAARLRAFGRVRGMGTAWIAAPATPVPPDLSGWNWGAVFLTWLWALRHKTYGVVLGCLPLLTLSLAIGLWGMLHALPNILGWFVPFLGLSLVFPWLVPVFVLSLALGIWRLDPLIVATPPRLLTLLVLGALAAYGYALLLTLLGRRGSAWAWQAKPWASETHFHRVQRRWAVGGVGGLVLGFALVALTGFLDRPPQLPPQPFLLVPQVQGAQSAPVPCLAGLVQAPAGGVVAVTCQQILVGSAAPVHAVQWLTLSSQAPLATSTTSWGLPRHGVLLLPMPLPGPEVQGLTLETRTRLLLGEPIWFPNRDATAPGGYELVPGAVMSTAFDQVVVRLHQPIARQAQLGSPVLSQLTGHVIGFLAAWTPNTDTVVSLQLLPTWMLRQALVPPQDVLALRDVARQVASAAGAVPSGRGGLGVEVKNLSSELRQTFQVPTPHYGVLVHDVIADTPAHKAGIGRHDIILEFQGKQVLDKDALPRLVQAVAPGTTVEVVLWRQGTRHPVWVTLGSASDAGQSRDVASPPHDAPAVLASGQGRLGLQIQELTPLLREAFKVPVDIHGVLVSEVEAYAPAATAGIERGDVLIAFQGVPIQDQDMQTFSRLVRAVAPGTTVEVVRWRQGSRRTLLITLGSMSDAEPQAMQRPQPHEGGPLPQAGQEQDLARAPDVTEDEVRAFVAALDAASHRKDADEFQTYFAPDTTVEITLHTPLGPHTQRLTPAQVVRQLRESAGLAIEVIESQRLRLQIRLSTDGHQATVTGETLDTGRVMGMTMRLRTHETFQVGRAHNRLAITAMQVVSHLEGFAGFGQR